MTVPFAINGLGRVGRALWRVAQRRSDLALRVVAVNDLVPAAVLARLLARDTVHGPFPGEVVADGDALRVDGRRVPVSAAPEPAVCPWAGSGARVVVESTGAFLDRRAADHLAARQTAQGAASDGVERVVISANAPAADLTLCLGINDGDYDPSRHRLISNASCTTHCVAPLARVLHRSFGLRRAVMTTVHSYTGNQRLLDAAHPQARRARAAAMNIIPVATTAPQAVGRVMPELAGRLAGLSVRVPTPAAAMMELVAELDTDAGDDAVRDAFRAAAAGDLAAVLAVSEEELVSSDFVGSPFSALVDLPLTAVVEHRLARVVAWYDNEMGYANRLAELVARLGAG